jgi:hypothetical protein
MIHDYNLALPYINFPSGFHNAESILKKAPWNFSQNLPALGYGEWMWNSHSDILNFASTSMSWNVVGLNGYGAANPNHLRNHTRKKVLAKADNYAWDPFHAMLYGYLHGDDMNNKKNSWKSVETSIKLGINMPKRVTYVELAKENLLHAPCEGPHGMASEGIPEVKGWNVSKRWHSAFYKMTNELAINGGTGGGKESGYYSGLDYMMLHNLYYLNSDETLPTYVNYIYRYFNTNIPNIPILQNFPLTFAGYVTFTADNVIATNMDVTYNASELITLKPGFNASNGSTFHAEIKPVDCNSSFMKANTSDSLITLYGGSTVSERHVYADLNPKFEHLYTIPDSISIEDYELQHKSIKLFASPNPASDFMKIECNFGFEFSAKIQIIDISGKICVNDHFNNGMSLDVSNLSRGIYFLHVFNNEYSAKEKFIKE